MYPDLSYFFHAVFGTKPDNWTSIFKTFGLFLVIAILSGAYLLYIELKRKAEAGLFLPEKVQITKYKPFNWSDIVSNLLFGFVLGFKISYIAQHFLEFQADPSGVVLSTKGHWLGGLLGAGLFIGLRLWDAYRHRHRKPKTYLKDIYPHHHIGDITIIAAIAGVIGAKLFDVLEHLPAFWTDPIGTLFSGSGLTIYGGLIFGFFAVLLYLRIKKIPALHVMDASAPALIIGYGIGRLGCHFSGDGDWGIVAAEMPSWWMLPDWLWAYDYPHHVINRMKTTPVPSIPIEGCQWDYCMRLSAPVYPTPIYESVMAFAIGGVLWSLRKRLETMPGLLFFIYLILNGVERFFIEKIRVNIQYHAFGIQYTQAELVALALIIIGIIGSASYYLRRAPAESG